VTRASQSQRPHPRQVAELHGNAAVVARLRAVVAEQLRAAMGGQKPAPKPAAGAAWARGKGGGSEKITKLQEDRAVARLAPKVGLGCMVASHHRSSASYQIR
jgi:hypothetical protein